MNRRSFLSGATSAALIGASGTSLFSMSAQATTPSIFKSEFAAAAANNPYLTPYRGAASDLYCEALTIEGKLPQELRGRFYRNGPAKFERGNERYQHWFDGDGMVQQFSFSDKGVSHRGRFVNTSKFKAESEAGEFLVPAFGTGIQPKRRITGPDSMNTANTNAIEHAGRVFAM
jgi:all-trans-8'-apo-beta-carotenal 15,15'-oxygenase